MPSAELKTMPQLTERYLDALRLAYKLHSGHFRKHKHVPYLSHLMSVSSLVLENGGSENEAIAALLHDAVEDQGGRATLNLIKDQFGPDVSSLVEACTDAATIPKPPWKERKEAFLKSLQNAPEAVMRIVMADKLHNLRAIYRDLVLSDGSDLAWEIFTGGKEGTLWYYRSLEQIFQAQPHSFLRKEYTDLYDQVAAIAGEDKHD